jgi:asparagine synthase (glutamine-hydrolysing)
MFAFAISAPDGSVFVARDRFGKKPLYHARTPEGALAFASEIKALFPLGVKGEVDPRALDNFLTLMYVPPWRSIYKNVSVVPPAHCGIARDGALALARYWEMPEAPVRDSYEDAKARVRELFDAACKKRMVADVEVGALLSGGVDSTMVCAYASRHASHPLKTFSLGYPGAADELPYALQASRAFGTDHQTLTATGDLIEELRAVIAYMDEPHADSSDFPQHLVSALAASRVKVALSGDGADELFLGYGWYWRYWNVRKIVRVWNAIASNPFKEYLKSIAIFPRRDRARLWKDPSAINDEIVAPEVAAMRGNGTRKINRFDLTTYLPGQLLAKIDQTGMMHSLEVRSPFLDTALAEYAYNLPERYKTDRRKGKILLKELLAEIMPQDFVYRRKQGFGAPVKEWLRSEAVRALVEEYLGDANAHAYRYLRQDYVDALLAEFYERREGKRFYQIWSLLCLELWFRSHHAHHA